MTRRTQRRHLYHPETKRDAVRRVLLDGQTQAQVSRDMEIVEQTINNWVASARKVPEAWGLPISPRPTPAAQGAQEPNSIPPDSAGLVAMRNAIFGALHALSVMYPAEAAAYDRVAAVVAGLGSPRTP